MFRFLSSISYVFQAAGNTNGGSALQNGLFNAALFNNVEGASIQRGHGNLAIGNTGGHQFTEGGMNLVILNNGKTQNTKGTTIAIANHATEEQNFDGQTLGVLNSAPKRTAAPGSIFLK